MKNFAKSALLSVLVTAALTIMASPQSQAQTVSRSQVQAAIGTYALKGLTANWTETRANYCSRFVRQIMQRAFPRQAAYIDNALFGASSYESESMWLREGRARSYAWVSKNGGLKNGDVVFQKWSAWGHVGIIVVKNGKYYVAENTIRYGYRYDHRALTPLKTFGAIRTVGRYAGF